MKSAAIPFTALLRRCLPLLAALLAGCAAAELQPDGPEIAPPHLGPELARMADGYRLPYSRWPAQGETRAVVLALHGFNDYRRAFEGVGPYLAGRGITTYAYDQRGFGETAWRGLWPGSERLIDDLRAFGALLREAHPGKPLIVLGESMGGAVVLAALARPQALQADAVVLVAPAVWARSTMNPLQRFALWLGARLMPGRRLSPKGLDITPSDNAAMLKALGADPLIIKKTRIDTLDGLTELMDRALAAAPRLRLPALILYGERDEIIPKRPTCSMLDALPRDGQWRAVIYPEGYHMLTRDLQAEVVLGDIAAWIGAPDAVLPSAAGRSDAAAALGEFCGAR